MHFRSVFQGLNHTRISQIKYLESLIINPSFDLNGQPLNNLNYLSEAINYLESISDEQYLIEKDVFTEEVICDCTELGYELF